MLYRNQRTGGNFSINSNLLSAEYPLLNRSTGRPWSGIGLSMMADQTASIFKTYEISMSYAVHLQLSRYQSLSFGAKGLYQSQRISLNGFYTGSQYIPDRGFDDSASSGEDLEQLNGNVRTLSAGFFWRETDKSGRVIKQLGFSFFDFNKPDLSFTGSGSTYASTLVAEGTFQAGRSGDWNIFPEALVTLSAATLSVNAGVRFQKELNPRPKQIADRLEIFTRYVPRRSGIIGLQLHREKISFGLSYDFPLLSKNPSNLGALEAGIELRKLVPTRAQKLSAKRKKAQEKSRLARTPAKKPTPVTPKDTLSTVTLQTTPTVETPTKTPVVDQDSLVETTRNRPPAVDGTGEAGKITHQPLIVEKVTLHFAFEFNSAELDDESEDFIKQLSTTLRENPTLKVKVSGHTDNVGSVRFNERLSLKRATAVTNELISRGIDASRIVTEGKGMSEPLNGNTTDEERAKNRRVEILIYQ